MRWDPIQYGRYSSERGRPFVDLVSRIDSEAPRRVVDVGCGPGNLTALLAERWPAAFVEGFDSSQAMIDQAAALGTARLSFRVADAATWEPPDDVDVIVSNATLQWVPGHPDLVVEWGRRLSPDGWLAFQVPGNFGAPSHTLMRELAESSRWRDQLADVLHHHDSVLEPTEYASRLLDAGLDVEAWETTYVHRLQGDDPVLEWVRGTGLRPVLQALPEEQAAEFEREYAAALRTAYPRTGHGTLFPFRRIFVAARRSLTR